MVDGGDVTRLLRRIREGDRDAIEDVFPLVYDELKRIARHQLARERSGHTLNTTGLVHEAYMRLMDRESIAWQDRAHFRAVASRAMRRILVDYARRRGAVKRGGGMNRLTLEENHIVIDDQAELLLSLDQALDRLAHRSQRLSTVVEYRFFGGLLEEEIAEVLQISARTVRRDWVKARAWLFKEMYADN